MPKKRKSKKSLSPKTLILASAFVFLAFFFGYPRYLYPSFGESVASLLFFLSYTYLLGHTLSSGFMGRVQWLERQVMYVGFGLTASPLLFVVMDSFGVPIRWEYVLGISAAKPLVEAFGKAKSQKKRLEKTSVYTALAFMIFSASFAVSIYGHYQYSYLEDGDSWEHALGAKYVSLFHTYTPPDEDYDVVGQSFAHYLPPYPPGYDTMLGVVLQLNSSTNWTVKVFNDLIVSLCYLFAYFMAKLATKDEKTAFYFTFVLFCLPPFASHAIWAHSLSITVLFVVFYAVYMIGEVRDFRYLSPILLGSSLLIQPLMSMVMGFFYIFQAAAMSVKDKKLLKDLVIVGAAGFLISLLYWIPTYQNPLFHEGQLGVVDAVHTSGEFSQGVWEDIEMPTAVLTFFPAKHGDMYMQHGFGLFIIALAALAIDKGFRRGVMKYTKSNPWYMVNLSWLVFSLLFLFALVVPFWPTRFWGIAALPIAFFAADALANLDKFKLTRRKHTNKILAVALLGVIAFSLYPKINVQTKVWVSDLHLKAGDFEVYRGLPSIAVDTKVYPYCMKDAYVVGYDKMSMAWDPEVFNLRGDIRNDTPENVYSVLKPRGYRYIIFDYNCVQKCMEEGVPKPDCKTQVADALRRFDETKMFNHLYSSTSTNWFEII